MEDYATQFIRSFVLNGTYINLWEKREDFHIFSESDFSDFACLIPYTCV